MIPQIPKIHHRPIHQIHHPPIGGMYDGERDVSASGIRVLSSPPENIRPAYLTGDHLLLARALAGIPAVTK